MFRIIIIILLLSASSNAGLYHSQAASQIANPGGDLPTDYGCASTLPTKNLSGAAYWVMKRWFETQTDVALDIGINTSAPPGSDPIVTDARIVNTLRHFRRDYGDAANKPKLMFHERPDLWSRRGIPSSADPRYNVNSLGCPVGSHSNAGGDRSCTFGTVPICSGGTRDGYWCRDATDADCPDGGTCEDVDFDPNWVLTIPTAEHEDVVSRFASVKTVYDTAAAVWDNDFLCDGTVFDGDGDAGCGAGYPSNPATLPADSIGKALYDTQGVWPLTSRPIYYIGGNGFQRDTPGPGDWTAIINSVAMDIRIPAWREWYSAALLDRTYHSMLTAGFSEAQIQAWPIVLNSVLNKPGWWTNYNRSRFLAVPRCNAADCSTNHLVADAYTGNPCRGAELAGTNMWRGPAYPMSELTDDEIVDCGVDGVMANTPYGPREYEIAVAAIVALLSDQTQSGAFFTNVELTSDDSPAVRDKGNAAALVSLLQNPQWRGARRQVKGASNAPWTTEKLCHTPPQVLAGGPYVVASGGTVQLEGMCISTSAASWAITTGGTGCTFKSPFDASTDAADPMAHLVGCTADGTITLTCGASASTAIVDVI